MSNWRDFASGDECYKVNPTGIVLNAAHTFGCWAKPDSLGVDGNTLMRCGAQGIDSSDGTWQITVKASEIVLRQGVSGAASVTILTTTVSTGTWARFGTIKAGAGVSLCTVVYNANDNTENEDPPGTLNASDRFTMCGTGDPGSAPARWDGGVAWAFWLQGIALTPTQLNSYLNDPQALFNAYGPSGTITANALKLFWGFQSSGASETDLAAINNGTFSGTTFQTAGGPSPTTDWNPAGGGGGGTTNMCRIISAVG